MHNVLITGIPRSGTTLVAALVDDARNAICLSEPSFCLDIAASADDADGFVSRLAEDCQQLRARLLSGQGVLDRRSSSGKAVTNYFTPLSSTGGRRVDYVEQERGKTGLEGDFVLGIKNNSLFMSALPNIVASGKFEIFCIIRNPVDVIQSWESLDLPIKRGKLPAADKFWPSINAICENVVPTIGDYVRIYDALLDRLIESGSEVLRYEDIISDPHAFQKKLTGQIGPLSDISISPTVTEGPRKGEIEKTIRDYISNGTARSIGIAYPQFR